MDALIDKLLTEPSVGVFGLAIGVILFLLRREISTGLLPKPDDKAVRELLLIISKSFDDNLDHFKDVHNLFVTAVSELKEIRSTMQRIENEIIRGRGKT